MPASRPIRKAKQAEHERERAEFARQLAAKLGITADKVEEAGPALCFAVGVCPGDERGPGLGDGRGGRHGGPGPGFGRRRWG